MKYMNNREIKFRAWDKKSKMIRTVDDLKNLWTLNNHGGDLKTIPNVIVINQSYAGGDLELVVGKDCDLMQYTGLKDKNDKEIYEGDILQRYKVNGEPYKNTKIVEYEISRFSNLENLYETEIIGNIHENKELLKQKTN